MRPGRWPRLQQTIRGSRYRHSPTAVRWTISPRSKRLADLIRAVPFYVLVEAARNNADGNAHPATRFSIGVTPSYANLDRPRPKHGTDLRTARTMEKNVLSKMWFAEWGRCHLLPRVRGGRGVGADDTRSVGPFADRITAAASIRAPAAPDAPTRYRRRRDTHDAGGAQDRASVGGGEVGSYRRRVRVPHVCRLFSSAGRWNFLALFCSHHVLLLRRDRIAFCSGEHDRETPPRHGSARRIA